MSRPTVMAYYFPSWHPDPRISERYGDGWTEWQLLRDARPRFDGHRQPRIPIDGYRDESDPAVMSEKIELAADHGVDAFIFDFYWHKDGPFLQGALDRGFLGAPNRSRLKFALMWANHDWVEIFPSSGTDHPTLDSGPVGRDVFDQMVDHVIADYFSQPEYLTVDGSPYFSVYEVGSLIEGLGGIEATGAALDDFRRKTIAAGFPGLYLDATVWGFAILPGAITKTTPKELIGRLGFRSASSYVWIHHSDMEKNSFPVADWQTVADDAFDAYEEYSITLGVPFIPNVTVGWDASPRTRQNQPFQMLGYPWLPVMDATPEQFETALRRAKDLLERTNPPHPMLAINAWNEWTEGSALEPDTVHGTGFLDAIVSVFGIQGERFVDSTTSTVDA